MKAYLVQHGEAATKDVDPERPLTEQGKLDVERVAAFLRNAGVEVARVIHSGKLRAEQTATILANAIAPDIEIEKMDGLAPNDEPALIAEELAGSDEDIMMVGHLPFMSRMASLLVTGTSEATTVSYRPGSVVCLESGDDGTWTICWMMRPDLLK